MQNDGKPILVNGILDTGSFGYFIYDKATNSYKYPITGDGSYIYNKLATYGNEKVLHELNDSDRVSMIYGMGTFFKLDNSPRLWTFMNNKYGCAGTGSISSDVSAEESFAGQIYNMNALHEVDLNNKGVWRIRDVYSWQPGSGCKTYICTEDRTEILCTGFLNNEVHYEPVSFMDFKSTGSTIKNFIDLDGGGLVVLLYNGQLYYKGDNDSNFITGTMDRPKMVGDGLIGNGVTQIYGMANGFIWTTRFDRYYCGYAKASFSNFILGLDVAPNTKNPFPGVKLTHLPFSTDTDYIADIVPLKYGIATLARDGYIHISGRNIEHNDNSNRVKLESTNAQYIAGSNGYNIVYKEKDDIRFKVSNGTTLKNYIDRTHIYHPDMSVL